MKKLQITIERMGERIGIGTIEGNDYRDAFFSYADSYLTSKAAIPISISLPLQEEPFSTDRTRTFFEGLLPEGFTRRSVAQWMHADENDYLSILSVLGEECIGAIQVKEAGASETVSGYEELTSERVRELALEGASRSAQIITKTHLSLAGASGKVGLYYDEESGRWFLPLGNAPSTHIIKQSHVRLSGIVLNEQLCMMTAKRLGIDVPDSFIINTGNGSDEDVLYATRRYDRTVAKEGGSDGLRMPWRLHQEDFAQALGIPSIRKYESAEDDYLKIMFDLLRRVSADPIRDQLALWDSMVFHYLIGNTDGHIKNFSLVYSPDLATIRFAPVYDIISTIVYPESTRNMALGINGVYDIDAFSEELFEAAAEKAGLGKKMAMQRFAKMKNQFEDALTQSTNELQNAGFIAASGLRDQILLRRAAGLKGD